MPLPDAYKFFLPWFREPSIGKQTPALFGHTWIYGKDFIMNKQIVGQLSHVRIPFSHRFLVEIKKNAKLVVLVQQELWFDSKWINCRNLGYPRAPLRNTPGKIFAWAFHYETLKVVALNVKAQAVVLVFNGTVSSITV